MHVRVGVSEGDFVGRTNAEIQQAIDAVGAYGGGTVEIGPGEFSLYNTVRLRPNVRLVGAGTDTVLRKCDGAHSQFAVDADYGQKKVSARDPSSFRAGMGVVIRDDRSGGWHDTLATITLVQGNTLYLDSALLSDYDGDAGGVVYNAFPLIGGWDVDSVVIEGICADGNRGSNLPINGCIGGGIYLHRARNCRIADCIVRDFAGDGISFQTTQNITVERCEVLRSTGIGFHPGTGSAQPVLRDCRAHANDGDGIFLCWRVQDGRFEGNQSVANLGHGISIGHKDTDNVFVGNVIRGNRQHGIYFRDEKASNAGSRNTFQQNVIEDNGDCGVFVAGQTTDLLFEANTIRDTRAANARTQRIGICVGEQAARVRAVRNRVANHVEADYRGEMAVE